ncbi:hypothetical protein CkaCkLH20_06554 [Colletotrichum karsti]|uniref:Uncharacterized protein n=1 Tax=Colletotrichum karsti TaxID=1095194 RepID=A0A9P6I4A5_9PEZI|nr:uncharacterized protein CkaCkLH20_06554 [Colletotrichum karsti]KAF9876108.1 hypothetical protein CkaCkLH20_06554 [Colletotrichum karsti]
MSFEGDSSQQTLLRSSYTIEISPRGSVASGDPSNLASRDEPYEIPETPPGSLLPLVGTKESFSDDDDDSWMNEFVNFRQEDTQEEGTQGLAPITQISNDYHEDKFQDLSSPQTTIKSTELEKPTTEDVPPLEDDYGLDDSDEEDMLQLADNQDFDLSRVPPASVLQRMDRDSRSPASFDSGLQHSTSTESHENTCEEPDLLDEDVDWDLVTACVAKVPAIPNEHQPDPVGSTVHALPIMNPFARPPFPAKMRDRSVVVGFSSTVMLRTCFRIGELLNAHTKCSRDKQDVILELFARVTYSNRDSTAKTQHFQMKDLFTDRQPFLSGTFNSWKVGGLVDEQSKAFLGHGGKEKLCRCVCKLSDDQKSPIGRSATILSIRETDWDEIQWALRVVARDADDDGHEELTSSAT